MLTDIEGKAMPGLRKVLAKEYGGLSLEERVLVAYLISFQEFRTPWSRANFQRMQMGLTQSVLRMAANTPGHFEHGLEQLIADGEIEEGCISADAVRDALKNETIKLKVEPHSGIDLLVSMGQDIGNIYAEMQWRVLRPKEGHFVTSDAPVVRRNPAPRRGFGDGGLFSPTAEVWFPLSKEACLVLCHDRERLRVNAELIDAGKIEEAEKLRAQVLPISDHEVNRPFVAMVNSQTIATADRFIYSPFQSDGIKKFFKGECQNSRMVVSPPPPVR